MCISFIAVLSAVATIFAGCGGRAPTSTTCSISGAVSGAVQQGITITLSGAGSGTATTDSAGHYSFNGLQNGSYTVTPTLAGYIFDPSSQAVTISNANASGINFTAAAATYNISGTVTLSGTGLKGVTITLGGTSSGTATTDVGGNYTFTGLANGSYTITPSKSGYTFSPSSSSRTVNRANVTGANFTVAPTVSPLAQELLQPGQIVEHAPTGNNPYAFYSYFPRSAATTTGEVIVGVWPHGGGAWSEDYSYHKTQAAHTLSGLVTYAEQHQIPVVVVAIPRVGSLYVQSLHPGTFTTSEEMLRRPDLKLIDAVWNQYIPLMQRAGLTVNERVFILGFSSPAMFAHRFTILHPDKVKAVWLGADAPAPLPATELDGQPLDYPLGVRDLEALTGKPFDFETYKTIPHFVCIGENDVNPNNDTTNGTDIFTEEQRLFIRYHFGPTNPERIRFFYEYLVSVGVPAQFYLYNGIGHEITDQMMRDAFSFLMGCTR